MIIEAEDKGRTLSVENVLFSLQSGKKERTKEKE
jgi:hypothetical protein